MQDFILPMNEENRIRDIYSRRDSSGKPELYSWYLTDVRYLGAMKDRLFASSILATIGDDLSELRVLDVGCGTGVFLRKLIEWGSDPSKTVGTELLEDRLQRAKIMSPETIEWRLGDCGSDSEDNFDLISAHTVFTSILDDGARRTLAAEMWKNLRPGGWLMIFDFRYDNPANPNVRKVTRKELKKLWPARKHHYVTGLLAPPLARRLVGNSYAVAELLTMTFPFLRSHFVYMAQK